MRAMNPFRRIKEWFMNRFVDTSKIENAFNVKLAVSSDMHNKQKPLIIQPIWKTEGNKMRLKDDCLDVFVWSNLAIIQMCCIEDASNIRKLNRFHRTIIWIYKMLLDYVTYDTFDYKRIIRLQSYNLANDKAFAMPGAKSRMFLKGEIVLKPRISKCEIKKIILGGGQLQDIIEEPNLLQLLLKYAA